VNSAHTIDYIYLQNNSAANGTQFQALLDFVAKSENGSIAALVPAIPEPATFTLLGLLFGAILRRARLPRA
jgi:PEP-CTERM motif